MTSVYFSGFLGLEAQDPEAGWLGVAEPPSWLPGACVFAVSSPGGMNEPASWGLSLGR